MTVVERIYHHGDGVSYEWGDEATEWEREAVTEYGVLQLDEVGDALDWRKAMDEMDNQQAARVMRGKHPTKDRDIGRPKDSGNRPDHAGQ